MKYAEHIDPMQEREKTFEERRDEIVRRAQELIRNENKKPYRAIFIAVQEKTRAGEIELGEEFNKYFQAAKQILVQPRNVTREQMERVPNPEPKPRWGIGLGIPKGDED